MSKTNRFMNGKLRGCVHVGVLGRHQISLINPFPFDGVWHSSVGSAPAWRKVGPGFENWPGTLGGGASRHHNQGEGREAEGQATRRVWASENKGWRKGRGIGLPVLVHHHSLKLDNLVLAVEVLLRLPRVVRPSASRPTIIFCLLYIYHTYKKSIKNTGLWAQ